MSDEISKSFLMQYEGRLRHDVKAIINLLREDMLKNGTRVMLENEEIYTKIIKFNTENVLWNDFFDIPLDQVDFSTINIDDLWAYIYGEYILKGKIKEINGFGVTQTETY
jgi:hypothetical protein